VGATFSIKEKIKRSIIVELLRGFKSHLPYEGLENELQIRIPPDPN